MWDFVNYKPLTVLTGYQTQQRAVAWSPDDTKIAYSTTRNEIADIAVMNTDGSNVVNLTSSSGTQNYTPKWSPDGKHIAFSSKRTGNYEIWMMNGNLAKASLFPVDDIKART